MAIKNVSGKFLLLTVALFIFSSVFVSAQTYINITIIEEAHQNVTFAENFTLEERVVFSIVTGWINVTNPSDETVYDVRVRLNNMSNLETNVSHVGGRHGVQAVGLTTVPLSINYPNPITTIPQRFIFPQDLDRDNRTDFIWLNLTHLIIDLSTETQLLTFPFPPGEEVDQIHAVDFDMEPIISSSGELLGWIDGAENLNAPWQIDGGVLNIIQAPNDDYVVLHIPELRPGDFSLFTYNATADIDPPLNIDTDYIHPQRTKVLANECFQVIQSASNEFEQGNDLFDINVVMEMQPVAWENESYNFSFQQLYPFGDHANVDNITLHNHTWFWEVNGSYLAHGHSTYINYSVCAPVTVPNSSTYLFLVEQLNYRTEGTITGIDLSDVKAGADLRFNFTKRIDRPTDQEENRYVIWEVEPTVATSTDIDFNVTKISLWVTRNHNPNNFTELKERYYPEPLVNLSNKWTVGSREGWYFNYTDGSTLSAPPPIIWMIPYYHIADVNDQIIRIFETRSGNDYYFKYIYVVNGYWLEVEKNVTNIGEDEYNVSLFVWNRGPGFTPRDLTVTVYDFVPVNFSVTQWNILPTADQAVDGAFEGLAVYWDIPPTRTVQNASFAPVGRENSTWDNWYTVEGEGEYRLSDLFIVGLDPRLVDGGSSSEVISVLSSMVSRSTESVYILVVFALVAINVLNYVLTKRKD